MGNKKTKLTKEDISECHIFEELKDWWKRLFPNVKNAKLTFQQVIQDQIHNHNPKKNKKL